MIHIFLFILSLVLLSMQNAVTLLVWFKKTAFVEYAELFGLDGILKVNEYRMVSVNDSALTYPSFLLEYHNSFFTRMTSCPVCLGTWLSIIQSLILFIPAILWFDLWLLIPVFFPYTAAMTYVSLYLYFKIVNIMK